MSRRACSNNEATMSAATVHINRHQFRHLYMWFLVLAGAGIVFTSLYNLRFLELNERFLILCLMTMASSLVAIKIPRVTGRITVADTFVFLTMMLYGGAAAILVSESCCCHWERCFFSSACLSPRARLVIRYRKQKRTRMGPLATLNSR